MSAFGQGAATVFVDADNTLWDTDGVFAAAQLNLLSSVEREVDRSAVGNDEGRLAFIRAADQHLAERHHAGLRYPPKLLINVVAAALLGETVSRAARRAVANSLPPNVGADIAAHLEAEYLSDLARVPALRAGVEAGLRAMEQAGCVVLIITEGPRKRVERTAGLLGLKEHFTRIVEGVKRPDLYRRILRLAKTPQRAFMIGDQLDRDILPAKEAGLDTVYFPGGFRPRWTPDVERVRPDHVVGSFNEVPAIVLAGRERGVFTTAASGC